MHNTLFRTALVFSVSAIFAVLLIVAGLMLRTELIKQQDENLRLSKTLELLESENRRLKIRCESAVTLTELEDYAINVLGMNKPSAEQTVIIKEDKSIFEP